MFSITLITLLSLHSFESTICIEQIPAATSWCARIYVRTFMMVQYPLFSLDTISSPAWFEFHSKSVILIKKPVGWCQNNICPDNYDGILSFHLIKFPQLVRVP